MHPLFRSFKSEWWRFEWRYWRRQTPWDTQITPPEVMAFLEDAAPGKALDLGCGTGTNAIELAQRGWQVTAIDFSPKAIRMARRKGVDAGVTIDFQVGDVTALGPLAGPYDYALDIGCLHGLPSDQHARYVHNLSSLIHRGGRYMLYAWLPRPWRGSTRGIAPDSVESLLTPDFTQDKMVLGEESDLPSAWYWFTRC